MSPSTPSDALAQRYGYDAVDRLVAIQPSGQVTWHRFYSGNMLSNELAGDTRRSPLCMSGLLYGIREQQGGTADIRLLATEQRGSVLQVLGNADAYRFAYTPYGEGAGPSLPGFNGEQPDNATGHYLLGNGYRAYNPALMRFHSPDSFSPFGSAGGNAYVYCLGDPVNRADPTGHISWQAGLGIGLGVLGLGLSAPGLYAGVSGLLAGLTASSVAATVGGLMGVAASASGIASGVLTEQATGSGAAAALGWVSLGLGLGATLAGAAGLPALRNLSGQEGKRVASLGLGDFVAIEGNSPPLQQIIQQLSPNDLIALASTSSQMQALVYGALRPISPMLALLGNSSDAFLAARPQILTVGTGITARIKPAVGHLPGQLTRAGVRLADLVYRGPGATSKQAQIADMSHWSSFGIQRQRDLRRHWRKRPGHVWWRSIG